MDHGLLTSLSLAANMAACSLSWSSLWVGGTHTSHGEYQTDIHARQGTDQVEDIVANSIATGGRGQCMHSQAVHRLVGCNSPSLQNCGW